MKPAIVKVRLLRAAAPPGRQTAGAAGLDLAAAKAATIPAHGHAVVGTGLALELPAGLEAQVRPRSGLAARHGIGVLNSPGTVDSDYRGEVMVILFNCTGRRYAVKAGERIAQLVFSRTTPVRLVPSTRLSRTRRGKRGLGHTGRT